FEAADLPDGGPSEIKEIQIEATKARYVKYVQLKRWTHTNKNKYSGSIYEFEVYEQDPDAKDYSNIALNRPVSASS
ncbi:hypothetical protein LIY98_13415, partial [Tyzzerella nexilis]|nr:hypothetical protein [[Clostridium] nexile]